LFTPMMQLIEKQNQKGRGSDEYTCPNILLLPA
jgi:hypothetical protein